MGAKGDAGHLIIGSAPDQRGAGYATTARGLDPPAGAAVVIVAGSRRHQVSCRSPGEKHLHVIVSGSPGHVDIA